MDDIEIPSFASLSAKPPQITPEKPQAVPPPKTTRGRKAAASDELGLSKILKVNSVTASHIGNALREHQGDVSPDNTFNTVPLDSTLAKRLGRAQERGEIESQYKVAPEHKNLPLAELADTYGHTLMDEAGAVKAGHNVLRDLEKGKFLDITENESKGKKNSGKSYSVTHPVLSGKVTDAKSSGKNEIGLGFHDTNSLYEADPYYKDSSHSRINQVKSLEGGIEALQGQKAGRAALDATNTIVNPDVAQHFQDIIAKYRSKRPENNQPVATNVQEAIANAGKPVNELRGASELSNSNRLFPDRSAPHSQGSDEMKVLTGFPAGDVGDKGRERLLTNIEDTGTFNVPDGQTLDQYLHANREAIESGTHPDFKGEHEGAHEFERMHFKTVEDENGNEQEVPVYSLDSKKLGASARAKEFFKQEDEAKARGIEPGQWHPQQQTTMPVGLDYSYDNAGHLSALYQRSDAITDTMTGLNPDADSKFKKEIGGRMSQLANGEAPTVFKVHKDTSDVKEMPFKLEAKGEVRDLNDDEKDTVQRFLGLTKFSPKNKTLIESLMKQGNNIVGYNMSEHKLYEILSGKAPDAGTGLNEIKGYFSGNEKRALQAKANFFSNESAANQQSKDFIKDLRVKHFGTDKKGTPYNKVTYRKAFPEKADEAIAKYNADYNHGETGYEASRKGFFKEAVKQWQEKHPREAELANNAQAKLHNDSVTLTRVISQLSEGISPVAAFHKGITQERAANIAKIDQVKQADGGYKSPSFPFQPEYKEGPRESFITIRNHEGGVNVIGQGERAKKADSAGKSALRSFTSGGRDIYGPLPNESGRALHQKYQGAASAASKLAPYSVQSIEGARGQSTAQDYINRGVHPPEYAFDAFYHTPAEAENVITQANRSQAKLLGEAPSVHDAHLNDDIKQANDAHKRGRITEEEREDIIRTAHSIREKIRKFANIGDIKSAQLQRVKMKAYEDGGLIT